MGYERIAGTEIIVATLKPASGVRGRLKIPHDVLKNIFPKLQFVLTFFSEALL